MGGAFPAAFGGGPTAATASGVPMLVDYVSVAYRSSGATTPPPTTTSPSTTPSTSPSTTPSSPPGGGSAYTPIQAENSDAQSGTHTEPSSDTGGGLDVAQLSNGNWLRFDNVDFGATPGTQFYGRVASGAAGGVSGLVEVRLDSVTGPVIGSFAVADTGGWQSWRTIPANISAVTGVHTVYLTFTSGQPASYVSLNWFDFGH
jgi:hypothetical protein